MDDLSTLDWSTKPEDPRKAKPYPVPLPAFTALRPTLPTSVRSNPLPGASSNPSSKAQTSANDSFSNLVSFNSASPNKTLSLQEQQQKLLEQKAKQKVTQQQQFGSHYNGEDEQFWDNLASGRSTPAPLKPPSVVSGKPFSTDTGGSHQHGIKHEAISQSITEDEDDMMAAFKADAPVDSSSHFPKPFEYSVASSNAGQQRSSSVPVAVELDKDPVSHDPYAFDEDDPFGLAELPKGHAGEPQEPTAQNGDEDVLGLLGKPVSELPQPEERPNPIPMLNEHEPTHPQDQAMAELMEMGFPAESARKALESTESGTDIQQAVGWLLTKAHSESRQTAGSRRSSTDGPRQSRDPRFDRRSGSRPDIRRPEASQPAWQNNRRPEDSRRQGSTAPSNQAERDPPQVALEFGTAFLKTAGSLWKTSTKKVQQAVQDFNSDSDSSQPKWMRESGQSKSGQRSDRDDVDSNTTRSRRRSSTKKKPESVTDEAMMLESDRTRPPPWKPRKEQGPTVDSSADNSRDHSPAMPSRLRTELPIQSAFLRQKQTKAQPRIDPKAALNRQLIDDQASQAYVSSARRRRPVPNPPVTVSEPDLLENASRPQPSAALRPATTQAVPSKLASRLPQSVDIRGAPPSRNIPSVSSISLKASHAEREAGEEKLRQGDYSGAHQYYSSALKHLPGNHPITIILYTNRALTALKIGEPKIAIADTEKAINIIGPSRGEAETIDLNNGEPQKSMRDYLGKALMCKAEALEQMERWKEAAIVWKEAVEGGYGGATSIQGRLRCEKAAAPQHPKGGKSLAHKPVTPRSTRLAGSNLTGTGDHLPPAAAVKRLRAANAAADKADDEKFALADTVDAKLAAWKGSKADNLRALLGSLDSVLWPEAGWKKVGMAELVLPGKVKVQYMKGIAKVHPDKLSTAATTEQRMIAGAVFSTLNEAWEKFKFDNGL